MSNLLRLRPPASSWNGAKNHAKGPNHRHQIPISMATHKVPRNGIGALPIFSPMFYGSQQMKAVIRTTVIANFVRQRTYRSSIGLES